jgi:hypothetical protein
MRDENHCWALVLAAGEGSRLQEPYLSVLPVPDCGWSDLGTPKRAAHARRTLKNDAGAADPSQSRHAAFLSLAAQHRHFREAAR